MNSANNKFLTVSSGVILDDFLDSVIVKLDPYFEKANHKAVITSGIRTADDQLRIIQNYLHTHGLDKKYPEAMNCRSTDKMPNGDYDWQMGWSALLNAGIIINPPYKAVLLMDYIGAGGVNKRGQSFNQTIHASKLAIDIGGGADGLANETEVIKTASMEVHEIVNWVVEHNNNCLHLNLRHI